MSRTTERSRAVAAALPWKRLAAELAVIVAGVLIALGADSWWEARQERQQARAYLEQLLSDFHENERQLGNAMEADGRTLEKAFGVVGRAFRGEFPSADSLDLPTGYHYFQPLTGTLTALVEGGDLRLLESDSLRFALVEYASLIDQTEAVLRHSETLIWNSTERLALGRARHSRSGTRWGAIDVAGVLNDPEVISALQVQGIASQVRLFNLGLLEDPTRRVITLIQAELDR